MLISVQAVVFKALAVLFYLYFIKGISLQRTNKRSVPSLNVRNPVSRGYKQISCPAVKSLLLKWVWYIVSYIALATLAFEGLCLPSPRGDSGEMQFRGRMDCCWSEGTVGPQGAQSASVTKSVERSTTARQGAANAAWIKQTMSYRTILKDFVFNPAVKISIF